MEDKDTVAIKWSRHELDNGPNQQNNISSKKIVTDLHTDMNAPIWNSLWKRKHPVNSKLEMWKKQSEIQEEEWGRELWSE